MSDARTPPVPDGVPVLKHALAFNRDPFGALESWAEHGAVVHVKFPGQSMYVVSDPALVEEILHDGAGRFELGRTQQREFRRIEEHAVQASTGERWRRLRRALGPAFARENLQRYTPTILEETLSRVDSWSEGDQFDLHREMQELTLNVVAASLLDTDVEGTEDVVLNAVDALVDRSDVRGLSPFVPSWLPTPGNRRFERVTADLHEFVEAALEERRRREDGRDACSIMLAAHERGEVTIEEVRDNLVGLFLAGTDTSATGLTYCWYLLSEHPDVRESVWEEYDGLVDDPTEIEDWTAFEAAKRVVFEALRLYPPAWTFVRRTTRPVELGGYEIPADADLMLPQWVLHRDERYWERPETFDPDRWTRDVERPEYAYFPFSGGPRHCMGMYFAQQEMTLALAATVGHVDLRVEPQGELTFQPALSLRPEVELRATVHRR